MLCSYTAPYITICTALCSPFRTSSHFFSNLSYTSSSSGKTKTKCVIRCACVEKAKEYYKNNCGIYTVLSFVVCQTGRQRKYNQCCNSCTVSRALFWLEWQWCRNIPQQGTCYCRPPHTFTSRAILPRLLGGGNKPGRM